MTHTVFFPIRSRGHRMLSGTLVQGRMKPEPSGNGFEDVVHG